MNHSGKYSGRRGERFCKAAMCETFAQRCTSYAPWAISTPTVARRVLTRVCTTTLPPRHTSGFVPGQVPLTLVKPSSQALDSVRPLSL